MLYCFLASGFEETEAVAAVDTVRRGGIDVKTVGIGSRNVTGSHGITVVADMTDDELTDISDMTGVILPGGMPGTLNLGKSEAVEYCLNYAAGKGLLIAAICAAPSVVGRLGLLKGRTAVCFDGFEEFLTGATIGDGRTACDGNFITARGPGVSIEFGLEIVRYFKGGEKSQAIGMSMKCKK